MISKIVLLWIIFVFTNMGCVNKSTSKEETDIVILYEENNISKKWASYLQSHLNKRAASKTVLLDESKKAALVIRLLVDADCSHDYCIERTKKEISIIAKEQRTMLWLTYQLISYLSVEDKEIDAGDLPPPAISFETECRDFDFAYREPYFSPNLQFEYAPLTGTDMVETSWGLWGHGIKRVLKPHIKAQVYAKAEGKINKNQFCFSSTDLYILTKSYIIDNFGNGEEQSSKFMLMPNDNRIVCTCDKCTAAGNTRDNATPALSDFILKLARSYPAHSFYTTAYLTTKTPPEKMWPENTGVMISTIDLPKGIALKPSENVDEFVKLMNSWKSKVPNVSVWDYAANFDDWLTPIPILYALQKQLQFFKAQGANGVFLNGSGYDYSPFDDVKTYVASVLMINVNAPVDSLCRQYFAHFYPVSAKYLGDYYLSLEHKAQEANKPYDIYGSFNKSIIYDSPEEFVEFYNRLYSLIKIASGKEKNKLVELQTSLSFTRLRLASEAGFSSYSFAKPVNYTMVPRPEIKIYIERLKQHGSFADMKNYKETNGLLENYIKYVENGYNNPVKNLLIGANLTNLSKLDEEYDDVRILQDGIMGYTGDYHIGWMLISKESSKFEIKPTPDIQKGKNLKLRFLNNPKHKILPPSKILIYINGKWYAEIIPDYKNDSNLAESAININLTNAESLVLEFVKQPGKGIIMANDEIIIN